ncbi:putative cyanidin 3-O-glucoside 7-O-glucosyltransferase (acyl-glucose) [Helianthus annuus]|nr:putative cyanidin 3-O-glucoside 7-O-glucosyltransferase (acyl-glucose) [Helianthus annuus]
MHTHTHVCVCVCVCVFESQFEVDPLGLQKLLNYLKEKYGNPPIYIHENGIHQINYLF